MNNRTRLLSSLALAFGAVSATGCTGKMAPLVDLKESSLALPAPTVSVVIKNYSPQSGQTYQNLFASNFSVTVNNGKLEYSSARDGLSDTLKSSLQSKFGFTVDSPESAIPGFQDLVLFRSGVDTTQRLQLRCAATQMGSASGDLFTYQDSRTSAPAALGLRDCDKSYMGLKPGLFDNNGNGIPDYLELRCGMNPANKIQGSISTAADGMTNLEKCRRHIPISESATTQPNQLFAYQYSTSANPDGTMNLKVSNIPVLNDGQDNFIAFYVVEANATTKISKLYTAFMILKSGMGGQTLEAPYWATSPIKFTNQQIILP